jgi:DNA repair exonuclease SbcCD nuclease subunit
MKLAIISDSHIGRKQYRTDENGFNRFEHIGYRALRETTNIILENNPDLIINAGDVFDTANPSILAMKNYHIMQEKFKGIPTMTILGNHDFSFANKNAKCSAVEMSNHTYFADYSIKTEIINNILFVMMPYIYTKAENLQKYFNECLDIVKHSNESKKILVTHGITERYHNESLINDPFLIPDSLVECFDLVIIGHIHTPFNYKEGKTLVLSPGSMIDYQAPTDRTGPIFLDTDTMRFEKILVKTPHIIKKECTEKDINNILSNVTEDIYQIRYTGDTSVIDNDIFIKAKEKAVNLIIDVISEDKPEEEKQISSIDFWKWLDSNYPDYNDVFKKAREEVSN